MKHVRLESLTLINWRGERNRTTAFHSQGETTIQGANGLGKSRHFDAFMWLLFGKDSNDRKDYNVKTIVDGEPLGKTNAEVVGQLRVDGEVITLRRVLVERWVKPRGQAEQVFKGNETECYWNDTPVSVGEYQKRVGEIIDDSVFKMITNPLYFVGMPWRAQREQLFQMAGTRSDEEIAEGQPDFRLLLDKLSGKSLSDFKRELSARKRKLKADLDEIQPRIDQTQKLMPQEEDWEVLEAEVSSIEAEISQIDRLMGDILERTRQETETIQGLQTEANVLGIKLDKILFEAKREAQDEAHKANAERREAEALTKVIKAEWEVLEREAKHAGAEQARLQERKERLTRESDTLRERWYKTNEETYQGETTCKCCGQELPEEMRASAKRLFEEDKQSRLAHITQEGKRLKEEIITLEGSIKALEQDQAVAEAGAKAKDMEMRTLLQSLTEMGEVKPREVKGEEIEEYRAVSEEIEAIQTKMRELAEGRKETDTSEYQERKRELTGQRDEAKARLSDRGRIEQFKRQIGELEEEGRAIAQQIAEAEQEEFTIAQFTKAKVDEAEKRINALFSRVTFKLFDYTIEDTKRENPIETCEPLVNGVPFSTTNTAGQVNAGLDIINALTRFWGITAPIFIDGRESVNEIIETPSQIINLKVTDDKELIIK